MINFCTLFSGSSGNSTFVAYKDTKILVDAGKSGKTIENAIDKIGHKPNEIKAILVTHEHTDHIKGVGILSRKYNIPIYANQLTWDIMMPKLGKIDEQNIKIFNTNEEFNINDIRVKAFNIPHDAVEPVGFSFHLGDKKITTATDIGHINENLLGNLKNSDILLIESNHDVEMVKVSKYPYHLKQRILGQSGHLSNESTGELLSHLTKFGVRRVLLGHLSNENNFPELAYQSVTNVLKTNNIKIGKDIKLEIAHRDKHSSIFEL